MKKKPVSTTTHELAPLITELRGLIQSARHTVTTTVNTLQVLTNFEIGRRIVEHEQKGEKRAAYGAELLKELSARLTEEFGKGFSVSSLQLMRKFFIENQLRIQQKPSVILLSSGLGQARADMLPPAQISQRLSGKSDKSPFTLSWSHYVLLLTIKNPEERRFYETEATNEGWSLPELKRQVATSLYERLALSRDKEGVRQLANEGQVIVKPEVNYFDRFVKTPEENPTIGILLCKRKKEAVVELTLPADANIHAREYSLYLPSKELLQQKLIDWVREREIEYGA